jgi:nitronate monooxygenase
MADLLERLGLDHPIVQAPMGGGASTPELVAAVSEAGGLGSLAGGYLAPGAIADAAAAVRRLTRRPFALNLFAPLPAPSPRGAEEMLTVLAPYHAALGIEPPRLPEQAAPSFAEQAEAVLAARPAVFSFTFGIPPAELLERFRAAGVVLAGTATTAAEARALEQAGVDVVVAQGSEAGGHRGTFLHPFEQGLVGTLALVPQVVDAVRVPVVAAGGIMDGRGVAAVLALGASAAQLGTAFLACPESGVPAAYKEAIRAADDSATVVTRAFSGRACRMVRNRFVAEVGGRDVPDYPLQNMLTQPLRRAAGQAGRAEFLGLLAGQGSRMATTLPAAELVRRLANDAARVADELAARRLAARRA